MTDDELITAARQARTNAHSAWKDVGDPKDWESWANSRRSTDWSGASRHLLTLVEEADRRGIRHRVFEILQ